MTATPLTLDDDIQALIEHCEAQHGPHIALRAVVKFVGLDKLTRDIDAFYEEHPESEPDETRHLFSDFGHAYDANLAWLRKAIRTTMARFDWEMEELPAPWSAFVERLLLSDFASQQSALLAVLAAEPDNDAFLEDLFDLCEAIHNARPFALQFQINGRWPNPAAKSDSPLSRVEQALELKLKGQ